MARPPAGWAAARPLLRLEVSLPEVPEDALMPGTQVRNWRKYHALRRSGMSKSTAARITNAQAKSRRSRRR